MPVYQEVSVVLSDSNALLKIAETYSRERLLYPYRSRQFISPANRLTIHKITSQQTISRESFIGQPLLKVLRGCFWRTCGGKQRFSSNRHRQVRASRVKSSNGHSRINKTANKKERCSGSFHLAVGFLVIKDDSVSGEGLMVMKGCASKIQESSVL